MDKILIIDDDKSTLDTLTQCLKDNKYNILFAENGTKGISILRKDHPDLIISDLMKPEINGLNILRRVKELKENINVIVITEIDDMNSIIEAMQLGAYDYLSKPIDSERLKVIIKRALESKKLSGTSIISTTKKSHKFWGENSFIGQTPIMKDIYKQIGQVSLNRVTALIQGESGTGKELIARIIHSSGVTKEYPFIAINCSALSETLLESELFGHVEGAFTGAIKNKRGKFELAGEGTIFLDEVSETSLNFQVKLLRVIQEKEFEKVGGESSIEVKARLIASTNRDLYELVRQGKFREDLYYRLKVFTISVPPLRKRKEDIPQLVVHFLKKINEELNKNITKIPFSTMEILQNHDWLGNVRELENLLTQAVILARGNILENEYIKIEKNLNSYLDFSFSPTKTLAEIEKEYIKKVLEHVKWKKNEGRKILGIAKSTLYKKIEEYNIKQM